MSPAANEEGILEIAVNDAYIPLLSDTKRFLVLPGGAGSGKSVFGATKIILRTVSELGHKFLCLRKVGDTVEESIYAELIGAIEALGTAHEFKVNKAKHSFLHIPTGNRILCKGLDDVAKMKSIKGITGMWLEETTEFDESDIDQLNLRVRGEKNHYVQFILSFNPIDENHWLKKRFIDKADPDATVLVTTYKDNHFLTQEDINQLLALADRNKLYYDVYVLAKWGIVVKTDKFAHHYDKAVHEIEDYTPNPHLPLLISFDFNVSPMTALVSQRLSDLDAVTFDEIELGADGVNGGSTEEMCEEIIIRYTPFLGNIDITGDATGHNREKARRGNITSYQVIKEKLGLLDRNILVRSKNLDLKDSKELCNSILRHAKWRITKKCPKTIEDIIYAPIKNKPNGHIEIIKTDEQGRHHLDNFRYTLGCFWPDFVRSPKKYRNVS